MKEIHPIIDKIINAPKNTFIIFFTNDCYYSSKALMLLRMNRLSYKGYNINNINGGMNRLLDILNQYYHLVKFNTSHHTKPIIFLNGKFIGGFDQLSKLKV